MFFFFFVQNVQVYLYILDLYKKNDGVAEPQSPPRGGKGFIITGEGEF